jgi:hypothetical protein
MAVVRLSGMVRGVNLLIDVVPVRLDSPGAKLATACMLDSATGPPERARTSSLAAI